MLGYNILRYFKMLAQLRSSDTEDGSEQKNIDSLQGIMDNTIRIARLKLLLIAAKITFHSKHTVKYSIYDNRTPGLMKFLNYLDSVRSKIPPWLKGTLWPCRFSLNM